MPIPRPEHRVSKFLKQPGFWDIVIAICAALGGILKTGSKGSLAETWWIYLIAISSTIKAGFSIAKSNKEKSINELEGCLHAMHGYLKRDDDSTLRVTIHVPIQNGQMLEQIMDYVGAAHAKRARRRFPPQCGVIGQAFRLKGMVIAHRKNENYEQYVKELVKEWNYTDQDARKCSPSTFSWLAVPLVNEQKDQVEGIVFFDSTAKDYFNDDDAQRIAKMCGGIARFVSQRY